MLRRIAAEGIGSLLLAATVIGSGIMAERLAAGNRRVRGDPRSLAGRPWPSQGRGRTLDGSRLDRRGLLVHLVHLVRKSGDYHRSCPVEHLCGHLAVPCSRLHLGSATRSPCSDPCCPPAVPPYETRKRAYPVEIKCGVKRAESAQSVRRVVPGGRRSHPRTGSIHKRALPWYKISTSAPRFNSAGAEQRSSGGIHDFVRQACAAGRARQHQRSDQR